MKIFRNILIIVLALLLQSTFWGRFTIFGARPDLAMLVLILLVSRSGQVESVLYGFFIGFWEDLPDYRTQGETFEELIENLKEIYHDLNSGEIPHVYHAGELEFA